MSLVTRTWPPIPPPRPFAPCGLHFPPLSATPPAWTCVFSGSHLADTGTSGSVMGERDQVSRTRREAADACPQSSSGACPRLLGLSTLADPPEKERAAAG
eukprot:38263-Hanusia_phi.AAC.1